MANTVKRFPINGNRLAELMKHYNFRDPVYLYETNNQEIENILFEEISKLWTPNKELEDDTAWKICNAVERHRYSKNPYQKDSAKYPMYIEMRRVRLIEKYSNEFELRKVIRNCCYYTVPKKLKNFDVRGHISIERLAFLMNVSTSTVKDWRNGKIVKEHYEKLCKLLDIDKDYLRDSNSIENKQEPHKEINLVEWFGEKGANQIAYNSYFWDTLNRFDSNKHVIFMYSELSIDETDNETAKYVKAMANSYDMPSKYSEEIEELNESDYSILSHRLQETIINYLNEGKYGKD